MNTPSNYTSLFSEYLATPPVVTDGYKEVFKFATDRDFTDNEFEPTVADIAELFLGNNYRWQGSSPTLGFDNNGLIHYSYQLLGVDLPSDLYNAGHEIDLEDVKPGDIIFQDNNPLLVGSSGTEVISASGKKKGIVMEPIESLQGVTSVRRVSGFKSKQEYINHMKPILEQALKNNGIDSKFTDVVLAQTALESGWGNSFSVTNHNYGGIKGRGSGAVSTKEWSPERGYYTIKDEFRRFKSDEEFADYYVKRLRDRFNAFKSSPEEYTANIRSRGYFTAPLDLYLRSLTSIMNQIKS